MTGAASLSSVRFVQITINHPYTAQSSVFPSRHPAESRFGLAVYVIDPRVMRFVVQELCESRGSRPGLSVLTSLLVSVDVKLY